ncbi:SRPBCC family protein [Streptomyces physcomitrii]|uniref:SRPBCC family protein n=1 Tax=Streptomyces physcomitrii TaxID=2724184 RepID=A0ABX1H9W7_9ACTN|nr:SRPBCC family protein [Streptomyces physcomitrii]NKI45118.1 SRPBCC family protein [Streptomyces physcomitrii]
MEQPVSESIRIAVPPEAVYRAVANVGDMGRWSPECTGARVKDVGAAGLQAGDRFTGRNAVARRLPWSTRCVVTAAEPGRRFTFEVRGVGLPVAEWSYAFAPTADGRSTEVTETWVDQRGPLMRVISTLVSGVRDRSAHNRGTMRVTLARLKESLESGYEAA